MKNFYQIIYHNDLFENPLSFPLKCTSWLCRVMALTLHFLPVGLLKQLLVTYMLHSNALLILYYVFTLRSCDRAVGVRYLISMQA